MSMGSIGASVGGGGVPPGGTEGVFALAKVSAPVP